MDPGGLGAIIGTGIMVDVFGTMKMFDIYKKRKKKRELERAHSKRVLIQSSTPKQEKQLTFRVKRHWKMKDLNLPKSYKLYNLSIRKF